LIQLHLLKRLPHTLGFVQRFTLRSNSLSADLTAAMLVENGTGLMFYIARASSSASMADTERQKQCKAVNDAG
jgi:hypothetical protein